MEVPETLIAVVREPSAAAVWELRGDLLDRGLTPEAKAFTLLAELHRFLDRLATGAASSGHSERASMMEVGSLSGVVASDLAEAADAGEWARRLLSAAVTEGLAVLATRQHVRAWRGELASVFREAAWYLYDELWLWASRRKPDLGTVERRRLLDQLVAQIRGDDIHGGQKTAIVCSLFLLLLVDSLAEE
jgi:hypothetical protein